jgi:DNA-binding NtrC family response regulator
MLELIERARRAARSSATVLIEGETGTGKEVIARFIHDESARSDHPFVRVNCAAFSAGVLESELFGHERGAFTGAVSRRVGRFEQAHRGTLFLDEVSEIPLSTQVKLLQFLQEREFERVGGSETQRVDVRVIAASNRRLETAVREGALRQDLFFRLRVILLDVPPLRSRGDDVRLLARDFLTRFAAANGRSLRGLTVQAETALSQYQWPGNVRELEHAIEHAVVMSQGDVIDVPDLPGSLHAPSGVAEDVTVPGATMAEIERWAILRTLESCGGSPSKAAAQLGIGRRTIHYRLREWGIRTSSVPNATDESGVHRWAAGGLEADRSPEGDDDAGGSSWTTSGSSTK